MTATACEGEDGKNLGAKLTASQPSRRISNASLPDSSNVSGDQLSMADISTEPFIDPSSSIRQPSNEEAPALSCQSSENHSSEDSDVESSRATTPGERTSAFMLDPSLTVDDESLFTSDDSEILNEVVEGNFDDEATISEEEALASNEYLNSTEELILLNCQSHMPIKQLLHLNNYPCSCSESDSQSDSQLGDVSEKASEPDQIQGTSSRPDEELSSPLSRSDTTFEPSVEMMVHDFDDEQTLAEEEALAAKEENDTGDELTTLMEEGIMPLEKLRAMYGIPLSGRNTHDENEDVQSSGSDDGTKDDPAQIGEGETDKRESKIKGYENEESEEDDEAAEPSKLHELYSERVTSSDKLSEGEEDEDYNPAWSENLKHVMIGPDYQANIPKGLELYDTYILPYENEDILLWNPQPISEQSTEEYLSHASAASNVHLVKGIRSCPQRMGISDDEEQLYILQKCQYNQTVALTRLKYNFEPTFESMTDWSERECRQFEDGLLKHGKNFYEIQKEFVTTRRINEIVQFYYMWKKQTNRPEVFLKQQEEKEKRKAANASDQAKSRKGSMDAASISDQEKDMFAASSSSPVASTSSAADKRGIVLPKRKYSTRIFNFKPQTGTRNPGFIQDAANPITEELNRTESITKRRRCNDEPISTDGGDAKIEENEV